jgi:hypothetical protein
MHADLFNPVLYRDNLRFSYRMLIGIKRPRLDGDIVKGRFMTDLVERVGHPRGRLIEEFVNLPADPENILRFTVENGPLENAVVPGSEFSFSLESFRATQENLVEMWRNPDQISECKVVDGAMRFHQGLITYTAGTLKSFLQFDLLTCPPERIKVCKWDGCGHPYFIAGDLKRRFCSVECSEEGRREVKRNWWEKNGQRAEKNRRIQKRKSAKHVA